MCVTLCFKELVSRIFHVSWILWSSLRGGGLVVPINRSCHMSVSVLQKLRSRDVGKSGINENAFLHLWYRKGTPFLRTCFCETGEKVLSYVVSPDVLLIQLTSIFTVVSTGSEPIVLFSGLCRDYSWPSINFQGSFFQILKKHGLRQATDVT